MFKKIIPPEAHGFRLDAALRILLPDSPGIRGVRRLFESSRVTMDGVPASKGDRVKAGQEVVVEREFSALESSRHSQKTIEIVKSGADWAAVNKPAGIHTEHISQAGTISLELLLPELFPGKKGVLLNRLDRDTSGLVMVALNRKAEEVWKELQDQAGVDKFYLTVVSGELKEKKVLRQAIVSAGRKRVKVLQEENPDPLRWSVVVPVRSFVEPVQNTLCLVHIHKGQRHQIRAHLAACGSPIAGDEVYGHMGAGNSLRLHHFRIEMKGFEAQAWPEWPEVQPENLQPEVDMAIETVK